MLLDATGRARGSYGAGAGLVAATRLGDAAPTWVVRAGYGIAIDPYSLARPWRTNYPILLAMSIPAANSFAYVSKTEDGIPPVPVEVSWLPVTLLRVEFSSRIPL